MYFFKTTLVAIIFAFALSSFAQINVRWTQSDTTSSDFTALLKKLSTETGQTYRPGTFKLIEDRKLATSQYRAYQQHVLGLPVLGKMIRIWSRPDNQKLIQFEASLEAPSAPVAFLDTDRIKVLSHSPIGQTIIFDLAKTTVQNYSADSNFGEYRFKDYWIQNQPARLITVTAKRGTHKIAISLLDNRILYHRYIPFPTSETLSYWSNVYPFYQAYKGEELTPIRTRLKYIHSKLRDVDHDPFGELTQKQYFWSKYDPIKAQTDDGVKNGHWSFEWLNEWVNEIVSGLPIRENKFSQQGLLLVGNYTTINIHPDAFTSFSDIKFPPQKAPRIMGDWVQLANDWQYKPRAAYFGKPILDKKSFVDSDRSISADNDPTHYINSGFDEIQVFYAVNKLFDVLKESGFTDPELSTRPFHAYLYNPDITMRDNAFYTNDTINFTTYSPGQENYARHNPTIWHELGHGIMDRLMGAHLNLADTGGLSEGMADFIAALVMERAREGQEFPGFHDRRIENKMGFYLSNEVHDDGEAYGGAMLDILNNAVKKDPQGGLKKITDLTLEAMRLSRDHPALTATDWFDRMLYADELGRENLRSPHEFKELIQSALAGRNFFADAAKRAEFILKNGDKLVLSTGPGSRNDPIRLSMQANETKSYRLKVKLKDGEGLKFSYPVQVRITLNSGPLQGAIDWIDEDKEPLVYTLNENLEEIEIPLTVNGTCDSVNQPDGSCKDYAYLQIWPKGSSHPFSKKRFYLQIKTIN